MMNDYTVTLAPLADMLKTVEPELKFNMIEIGALPLGEKKERFHSLLSLFPGSKVSAFELDEGQCKRWNSQAPEGLTYYATALGSKEEERDLFETSSPMCTSLYKPNQALLSVFNKLEVVQLKSQSRVRTISLDQFVSDHEIGEVDFIKIDVQGAELDIFQGAENTLENVSFLVSEVEFVPLYENQPLFGDVSTELAKHELMFHKFLGLAGRPIKNVSVRDNPRHASQHLWSDAVYLADVSKPALRGPSAWAKCAVYAFMYGSSDLCYFCLQQVDKSHQSDLAGNFLSRVSSLSLQPS